ncbi:endonuclease/exonuclease/phosphatase family protein [Rhodococcus sp. KBS0724]|uniref:endonuclease/exonuclease/phosphatase family protein n=1 Tax=Rhodococcus sp. KBS0724 TaxID=1179674 RepID=UPI0021B0ECC6|nr:endonuclease/exonuclease/phosphatase family protein [Rhodococcus sp. KBS0724]
MHSNGEADPEPGTSSVSGARRIVRRAAYIAGVGAVAVAALGVLVFYVGPESNTLIIASSFVPLMLGVGLLGLVALAATRSWRTLAMGVVVLVAGAFTQAPLFVSNTPDTVAGDAIRVMQANIRLGEADPDALVEQVRSHSIDVLTIQELTDSAVERLGAAGLTELLPYRFVEPKDGGGGTGIYSRFPLSEQESLGHFAMSNLVATADIGDGRNVTVAAVHPMPPYPSPAWMWASEMGKLNGLLHEQAADGNPMIVGGDFNSTYSHSRFRAILTDGFTDAAEQTGAGFVMTYPADTWYPALIGIDHIVTNRATVTEFERIEIEGSDHHGLVATVTPHFNNT